MRSLKRSRPPLSEFVAQRLGSTDERTQLRLMVSRAFGSSSYADFWRFWNPVYHYFLLFWVYQPLRRWRVPRSVAVVTTFAFCGFAFHDLFHIWFTGIPFVTLWFTLLAVLLLIGEAVGMDLRAIGRPWRPALVHALTLLGSLFATFLLIALLVN